MQRWNYAKSYVSDKWDVDLVFVWQNDKLVVLKRTGNS